VAALDRIPWFTRGGLTVLALTNRTLAQVTRYLTDEAVRQHAIDQVRQHLTPTTAAVIGHSLGSVIAYETVRELPPDQPLPLLITLGSPLGLSAVNRRLRQPPGYPVAVQRWVNLADRDDVVAARPNLSTLFDTGRPVTARFEVTYTVNNGALPHRAGFYLTKTACGRPLAATLHALRP
jgi:pimeloyl-ACP methyl ester carboxylesterase